MVHTDIGKASMHVISLGRHGQSLNACDFLRYFTCTLIWFITVPHLPVDICRVARVSPKGSEGTCGLLTISVMFYQVIPYLVIHLWYHITS